MVCDYGFSTGDSDYVFGQLQNHDDDYTDHFDGPRNVQVKELNGSSWNKICSKSEYLSSNYDYVKCEDSWHNTYGDSRTYDSYDYIDMGGWCNYSDYIWSRLS